jgi:hypothetical protein
MPCRANAAFGEQIIEMLADVRSGSFATEPFSARSNQCPLSIQSRTNAEVSGMSARCQKQTFCEPKDHKNLPCLCVSGTMASMTGEVRAASKE